MIDSGQPNSNLNVLGSVSRGQVEMFLRRFLSSILAIVVGIQSTLASAVTPCLSIESTTSGYTLVSNQDLVSSSQHPCDTKSTIAIERFSNCCESMDDASCSLACSPVSAALLPPSQLPTPLLIKHGTGGPVPDLLSPFLTGLFRPPPTS